MGEEGNDQLDSRGSRGDSGVPGITGRVCRGGDDRSCRWHGARLALGAPRHGGRGPGPPRARGHSPPRAPGPFPPPPSTWPRASSPAVRSVLAAGRPASGGRRHCGARFGAFWIGEGLGVQWPGADLSILGLAGGFLILSLLTVVALRTENIQRGAA